MLLSSIGRTSLERVLAATSNSTSSAMQRVMNVHCIRIAICSKDVPVSIFSMNFAKWLHNISSVRASSIKSKSQTRSTKSSRSNTELGAKKIKKPFKLQPKKKKPVKTLVKKPRKRKVISEEERERLKRVKLKRDALRTPRKLPSSARTVYMAKNLKGKPHDEIVNQFKLCVEGWKNLSEAEREQYERLANANRAANDKALKDWLSNYSPDEIRIANNARRQLKAKKGELKRIWKKIPDSRLPKRAASEFLYFVQERFDSGEFKGTDAADVSKQLAAEYDTLSPSDRKKYKVRFLQSQNRYIKEHIEAYNREPKGIKKSAH